MPELAAPLRQLVLAATNPIVSDRTADADTFLAALDAAVTASPTRTELDDDPLNAPPGTLVGGRYRVKRRLGSGSTAVGLLVLDTQRADEPLVLKVALNERANQRLADEAEVLASVAKAKSPRLIQLVEGPLQIGSRQALLLHSAGDQTLAEALQSRRRVSLDLLERWGTDLLEAVVALDSAGIDHRDIKPANLGIRESGRNRARHLVLFDFSLSRAGASATEAGTPPYLDPFLGPPARPTFDSAAERYSAAVTLYEMATGSASGPRFGDGASDPAMTRAEAALDPNAFDSSIADELTAFFRTAFRRASTDRFHTAPEMLRAWRAIFSTPATTVPPAAVEPDQVSAATPLAVSGLTARALSALEQLHVSTVGDLANIDPALLTRLSGVAASTRSEIVKLARGWRQSFRAATPLAASPPGARPLADVEDTATMIAARAGHPRSAQRRDFARIVLGLDGDVGAFALLIDLAAATGKAGTAQVSALLGQLQKAWATDPRSAAILDDLARWTTDAIERLGGVAPVEDVIGYLLPGADPRQRRIAAGLVRVALDRADDVAAGSGDPSPLVKRRTKNRVLLATDAVVLDAGAALGAAVDRLLIDAVKTSQPLVPSARAIEQLAPKWPESDAEGRGLESLSTRRLVRVAARMSEHGAVSARGELHDRDLHPAVALHLALPGIEPGQAFTVDELRAIVRARFPEIQDLPGRTELDRVVGDAGLPLRWDGSRYTAPRDPEYTTAGYQATVHTIGAAPVPPALSSPVSAAHSALAASADTRSFLALGLRTIGVERPRRLAQAAHELIERYGAEPLDITELVVEVLRAQASAAGVPWDAVTAADAAAHSSREWQGITTLVRKGADEIERRIMSAAEHIAPRPLLLTDAGPLARYGLMPILARVADITGTRGRAVWLLLPLGYQVAPAVDGADLQLSHSGQFVVLDGQWFAASGVLEGDPR